LGHRHCINCGCQRLPESARIPYLPRDIPTLVLISSRWYTKSEQAPRFAFWYCGLGAGQIIGGFLSFSFQHVKTSRFEGWRIMFVVLGGITVLLRVATFFWLLDNPATANFLSDAEREALLQHVSPNVTETSNIKLDYKQL
jgi:MFS family permease